MHHPCVSNFMAISWSHFILLIVVPPFPAVNQVRVRPHLRRPRRRNHPGRLLTGTSRCRFRLLRVQLTRPMADQDAPFSD
ncbi:hypothetical protein F5B17DRAFT_287917 [Nemania serpens]|nr:hypothetical protein F5B17DRAFT_287917 [Nemania serpens]